MSLALLLQYPKDEHSSYIITEIIPDKPWLAE